MVVAVGAAAEAKEPRKFFLRLFYPLMPRIARAPVIATVVVVVEEEEEEEEEE